MHSSIRVKRTAVLLVAASLQILASACEPTAAVDATSQRNMTVPNSASFTASPSTATVSATSWNSISVRWQTSPSASGYQVFRSIAGPAGTYTQIASTSANVGAYDDSGLTGSTQYCYEVRSFKYTGKTISYSAFSSPGCATTPAPPIAPPSDVSAVPQEFQILLKWKDNSDNEDGFRIEATFGGSTQSFTVPANTTSTYFNNGTTEQLWCFRIFAFNTVASIPSSSICTGIPSRPWGLAASVEGQGIRLSWLDNSALEDGYKVYRSDNGSSFSEIAALPANSGTYLDAAVRADVSYTYHVQAVKDGGYSYFSNDAVAVVPTAPPADPTNVDAAYTYNTDNATATLGVSWSDNSTNEAGFRIEFSWDGVTEWSTYAQAPANTSYFETTFWSQGGDGGCFRVIAFNVLGDSNPSNVACPVVYYPDPGTTAASGALHAPNSALPNKLGPPSQQRAQRAPGRIRPRRSPPPSH